MKSDSARQSEYLRMPQNQAHLKVMEVLRRWDPIGVITDITDVSQDEYDRYSVQIVHMLDAGATADQIVEYMRWVVTERMGIGFNESRSRDLAEELVRYWPTRPR